MSNYSIRRQSIITSKFLKLFGIGTFSIKEDKVHVTFSDFACLTVNLCIASIVFYLSLWYGLGRKADVLLSLGIFLTMNCASFVCIISIILIFLHRHCIWKLIKILDDVMDRFRKIEVYPNFTRNMIYYGIFTVMSLLLIGFGLVMMAMWLGYSEKPGILLFYGYLSASFATAMSWMTMFRLSIFLRLKLLTSTIR